MTLTREDLAGFTCTEQYHALDCMRYLKCTDGIAYLAKEGGAYWLIDAIASYQRKEPVQFWHLEVIDVPAAMTLDAKKGRKSAVLTMREDSDQPILVEQKIGYVDFPFTVDIWVMDKVCLLPSEY
jgi:hypothetical protein